jgi:hypothetical protein
VINSFWNRSFEAENSPKWIFFCENKSSKRNNLPTCDILLGVIRQHVCWQRYYLPIFLVQSTFCLFFGR